MAYHPQANSLIERFHYDLKASLRARLDAAGDVWADQLPWVLLGMRTVVKKDLKASSAELVYGEPPTVPGDFVTPPVDADASQHLGHCAKKFNPDVSTRSTGTRSSQSQKSKLNLHSP